MSSPYGELFDADGVRQLRFNASSIKAAQRCLQYYEYTVKLKLTRGTSPHLWFGDHIAKALQLFYVLRAKEVDRESAIRQVVLDRLIATWDYENDCPIDFEGGPKNRANLIRTIVWYFEEYNKDYEVAVVNGKPAVELQLEADIGEGVSLVGMLDRAFIIDGTPYVMDQKTTGSTIGPRYWDQWKPNQQMWQYAFLSTVTFPELPIAGVMIDAMQIAVGFTRFARNTTYRSPAELEEGLIETQYWIKVINAANEAGVYPRNPEGCSAFGGCAFRSVCSKSPEVRKNYLAHDFIVEGTEE